MKRIMVFALIFAGIMSANAQTGNGSSTTTTQTAVAGGDDATEARNKKIALATFEAYYKGDAEGAYRDQDNNVLTYHPEHSWPHKGLDSMKKDAAKNFASLKSAFPDRQASVVNAVADGDLVMLQFTDSAVWKGDFTPWKATGKGFNVSNVMIYKFSPEGKIIETRSILPFSVIQEKIKKGAETELNTAGYLLIEEKKYKDAIEIFKMNVKLYPESSNTYDSLGEAYSLDGNTKLAIKNYEMAVKLDPTNENGKSILEKLKAK